jgi:hypothetical protein
MCDHWCQMTRRHERLGSCVEDAVKKKQPRQTRPVATWSEPVRRRRRPRCWAMRGGGRASSGSGVEIVGEVVGMVRLEGRVSGELREARDGLRRSRVRMSR